ncbi:translocase of chloroplast 120, chloroplastic-like [Argentina anserina]|uniref:translocase of chloroplast 120, chloroplastic-like n=1 Tax=Argentina anserina TaxID=57926 RepID=UPI0021765CD1|nr:translocase of chloroplast 120, chloroplastic-like [Potentilla anserina]
MENGDGIVSGSDAGGRKVEVFEEKVVKDSNGVRDDVEEEVFEEAVGTGAVGDSPRAEDFEEAIEVLDDAGKSKEEEEEEEEEEESVENGGGQVENAVGGDGVDGGAGTRGVDVEELNASKGLADEELVGALEDAIKDGSEDGADGQVAVLTGENPVDQVQCENHDSKSNGLMNDELLDAANQGIDGDGEIPMLTNMDEVDVTPVEVAENEKSEKDKLDNSDLEVVPTGEKLENEGANLDSTRVTEFNMEDLKEAGTDDQDKRIVDLVDTSVGTTIKLEGDKGVELQERKMEPEHTECESTDSKDAMFLTEARQVHNKIEELRATFTCTDAEDQDSIKLKSASSVLDSEHDVETSELKDIPSEQQLSGVEPVASEMAGSAFCRSPTTDEKEKVQAGDTDSRSENIKDDEPTRADEVARVVSNNGSVPEEPEKRENNHVEKGSNRMNRVQEAQHTPAHGSSGNSTNTTPIPARPAGLGRAAPLLEPVPRAIQQPRVNGTVSHAQNQQIDDPVNGEVEESDETREKLQMIRVKFLRLAHRLGQTPHNVVVAQVLYRLGLAEQLHGRSGGRVGAFSFDRASAMAEQLEASGNEPLDFSCTIMVLGKSGVGKSATINSIFDEVKFNTDAFQMGTKKVQDVVGTVQGIKVRVIDTPGLLPSWSDQRQNEKILLAAKRFIKKTPPDIVLYLDRLDMQSRDSSDMPLLRTITEIFGATIWFNAIVVLTHAASAPPEGPNGAPSSYDIFVTQRSHVVQQAIRQAAGDMRLMNPISLVENHSACRTNRAGQRVLPNGQVWKPHLLLLSFASKILAEANALLKLQDSPPGRTFAPRSRAPPLPFLLSSLLVSKPQLKLPEDQFGDEDGADDDLDESSDSEDESEFDELPPFKRLTKAQVEILSKAQKKAYFDELEYREKLFMKKQLKEEKKRRKFMKKMAAAAKDLPTDYGETVEEESASAASVPVAMPDLPLPASFDSDNPTHRYRYLDSSNQWLVRPVLETHGWDHDVGYEGINAERLFVLNGNIPLSFSGQVTKDKKDANVQMELASSVKHGEGKASSVGLEMQTVGKDLAYTFRGDTRFSNFRKNKASAGGSVTLLGDALSVGLKIEDKFIPHKRFQLVMIGGAMTARGDVAYGGSLEAQLRDKDHPLGRSLSTLGLSVMDWHGDLAIGGNLQTQIPVGRHTNLIARANLNNRGAGQVSIRLNSSEQLQIALIGLIPLLRKLFTYPE